MRFPPRAALAAAVLAIAAPSAAHAQAVPGSVPLDAVMSSNVEYIGSLKADVGLTTGARVVRVDGQDRLFVTSGKNVSIYNIDNPASPQLLGIVPNVIWENEEVATNGKVLVFSSDWYSFMPDCLHGPLGGCVQFFDVRDPANPKLVATVNQTNHTSECALDCQYTYGSAGTIVDARGVLSGTAPKVIGNWINAIKPEVNSRSCHHIREIRPGVLLTACQPFAVISILEKDGGTPENPVVLAKGDAAKFVHSARWPRGGTDKFLLTGGEENFTARCELNNSEFSTYSAEGVLAGTSNQFQLLKQSVPAGNGVYADGKPVAGALGCSVHWFQEHPSFKDGGLVALSQYEDGVRFEQVKPDGSIVEQGYFLGAGSSSSSPKWAPDGKVLYSIDYQRGIDILRYHGDTYVPDAAGKVVHRKGKARGTNGSAAATRAQARLPRVSQAGLVRQLRANGWFSGYCRLASQT
jgi:hypothetical protein